MRGLDRYRGGGLALMAFGLASALFTYLLLGTAPLVALFLGTAVVGASMFLTPPAAARGSRQLVAVLNNALANLAAFLEALRVGTANLFVPYGGQVYVYLSPRPLPEAPREPPAVAIAHRGGEPLVALRAPVTGDMVEGFGDPCSAIEHLLVEVLDVADRVACLQTADGLVVRAVGPPAAEPSRVARALGGIHGLVAGAVAALYMGPVAVSAEDLPGERVLRVGRA